MLKDASLVLPSYLKKKKNILNSIINISRFTYELNSGSNEYDSVLVHCGASTHPTTEEKSVPIFGSMRAL